MDTLNYYRDTIKSIILEYAQHKPANGDIETEIIFDEAQDHYELMRSGWSNSYRIHGSAIHIDIRDGKIWIQHDGTEAGVANLLVEAGIPHDQIVLAFQAPNLRQYSDFAVS